MEILKNEGTFEIISLTDDIIKEIATAARTCYQSQEFTSEKNNTKLVENLIREGHWPMIEFASMTVRFDNISRGFMHEMVRHRLCSFAQESTRYSGNRYSLAEWSQLNEWMYKDLRKAGWKSEDARQVLPIGIKSQLVVKANLVEWRHIFKMRTSKFAHWEIRGVMRRLLACCKGRIPIIFEDLEVD